MGIHDVMMMILGKLGVVVYDVNRNNPGNNIDAVCGRLPPEKGEAKLPACTFLGLLFLNDLHRIYFSTFIVCLRA
jgi:hypothetical protein